MIKEYTLVWTSVTLSQAEASLSPRHKRRRYRPTPTDQMTRIISRRKGSLSIEPLLPSPYLWRSTIIGIANSQAHRKATKEMHRTGSGSLRLTKSPLARPQLEEQEQPTITSTWRKSESMQPSREVQPLPTRSRSTTSRCRTTLAIQQRQLRPVSLRSSSIGSNHWRRARVGKVPTIQDKVL